MSAWRRFAATPGARAGLAILVALVAVAALAAVVPTLRATRVNPASAMRAD